MLERIAKCALPTMELPVRGSELDLPGDAWNTTLRQRLDAFRSVYEMHNRRVRTMARRAGVTLVEIDIESIDAGPQLARSIGGDARCWGHSNAHPPKG